MVSRRWPECAVLIMLLASGGCCGLGLSEDAPDLNLAKVTSPITPDQAGHVTVDLGEVVTMVSTISNLVGDCDTETSGQTLMKAVVDVFRPDGSFVATIDTTYTVPSLRAAAEANVATHLKFLQEARVDTKFLVDPLNKIRERDESNNGGGRSALERLGWALLEWVLNAGPDGGEVIERHPGTVVRGVHVKVLSDDGDGAGGMTVVNGKWSDDPRDYVIFQ